MKDQILEELKRELVNGHAKKRHPFRYFAMATSENGKPKQRTVVLRKTLLDLSLIIYTDSRTPKIADIQHNSEFSALFYDSKKQVQLRISGKAELITDKTQIASYWHGVQALSRKDYTTNVAPGSSLESPDNIAFTSEENYFCPVRLIPNTIEYLRLQRPNHLRILFSKIDEGWSSEFLVP